VTDLTAPVLLNIDCREGLAGLAGESVSCVATSPPYWNLRDYGGWRMQLVWDGTWDDFALPQRPSRRRVARLRWMTRAAREGIVWSRGRKAHICALGMEPDPSLYVAHLVSIFREVRRVLRSDGVLFVVIGDSCCSTAPNTWGDPLRQEGILAGVRDATAAARKRYRPAVPSGLKPKDAVGIPWMLAFALRDDGWYLRPEIIWAKGASFGAYVGNPMPESVKDRPSRAHEYVFLLTKSERYFWDHYAAKEPARVHAGAAGTFRREHSKRAVAMPGQTYGTHRPDRPDTEQTGSRNLRSVWTIPPEPFSARFLMAHGDAEFPESDHYATFPQDLVKPMILAGCPERVCPECGKPWERLTEKTRTFESGSGRAGRAPKGKHPGGCQGGGATLDVRRGPVVHTRTLGFSPTCPCGRSDWLPGIVLDPFSGTGTTLLVAHALGRRSIGLDMSAAYCELARRRLAGPLFAAVAEPVMPPEPTLFGEEATT